MLLNVAIFMYIGMIIPWQDYSNEDIGLSGWRMVLLGITVILLRRPPWVIALQKFIPALKSWQQGFFAGWFGPIGVGAVYYIEVAIRSVPHDHTREHLRRITKPVVLFCVFSSVLTHGVTIPITYFGPRVMRHSYSIKFFPRSDDPFRPWHLISRLMAWEAPPQPEDQEQQASPAKADSPVASPVMPIHRGHDPFSRQVDGQHPPDKIIAHGGHTEHMRSHHDDHDSSAARSHISKPEPAIVT